MSAPPTYLVQRFISQIMCSAVYVDASSGGMGNKTIAVCSDFKRGSWWNSAVDDGEFGLVLFHIALNYVDEFFRAAAWKTNLQGVNFGWNLDPCFGQATPFSFGLSLSHKRKFLFSFTVQSEKSVSNFA